MRQKIRRIITFITLLAFPVILNFLSPYVSIDGAFIGVISGSVIVFILLFLSGLFFGRAWCSWVCPCAAISEFSVSINSKSVNVKRLRIIRYSIFIIWFSILISGFVLAGGIHGINPLHLTENFISVDEPLKYITYYLVLFTIFGLTIAIGKRGFCHTACWMSPFLSLGTWLGQKLHLPQLKIKADQSACISCKKCNQKCPMGVDVVSFVKKGKVSSLDCILCGECVDNCPKKVLKYGMKNK